jgi:hypothetical protein
MNNSQQQRVDSMDTGRVPFHLSLRTDDEFEKRLAWAVKGLPRGYSKLFFVRVARLFGRSATSREQLYRMMWDFVVDVKPLRLRDMPEVDMSDLTGAQEPVLPPQPEALAAAIGSVAATSDALAEQTREPGQVSLAVLDDDLDSVQPADRTPE